MLIPTISFEIHNFTTNTSEQYTVADTIENQELIFAHRYTRNIQFTKVFSFQFENEMAMPIEMISEDTWLRLATTNPELFAGVAAV